MENDRMTHAERLRKKARGRNFQKNIWCFIYLGGIYFSSIFGTLKRRFCVIIFVILSETIFRNNAKDFCVNYIVLVDS